LKSYAFLWFEEYIQPLEDLIQRFTEAKGHN